MCKLWALWKVPKIPRSVYLWFFWVLCLKIFLCSRQIVPCNLFPAFCSMTNLFPSNLLPRNVCQGFCTRLICFGILFFRQIFSKRNIELFPVYSSKIYFVFSRVSFLHRKKFRREPRLFLVSTFKLDSTPLLFKNLIVYNYPYK